MQTRLRLPSGANRTGLTRGKPAKFTRILIRTGNLFAVMRTIGQRDVKTAMHYQHPELDVVRAAGATETALARLVEQPLQKAPQLRPLVEPCRAFLRPRDGREVGRYASLQVLHHQRLVEEMVNRLSTDVIEA